jgi:hypothetical protein
MEEATRPQLELMDRAVVGPRVAVEVLMDLAAGATRDRVEVEVTAESVTT